MSDVVADDDDWIGTPPEGRHSRDRARPDFWRKQWQFGALGAGVLVVIVVLLIVLAAR